MPDESKTVNKFYAVSPAMMDDFIKKAVQAGRNAKRPGTRKINADTGF